MKRAKSLQGTLDSVAVDLGATGPADDLIVGQQCVGDVAALFGTASQPPSDGCEKDAGIVIAYLKLPLFEILPRSRRECYHGRGCRLLRSELIAAVQKLQLTTHTLSSATSFYTILETVQ